MLVNDKHCLKLESPMILTLLGITISRIAVAKNAASPIDVNERGSVNSKTGHETKAPAITLTMVLGSATIEREVHLKKDSIPTSVTVVGIDTDARELQRMKALSSI
jgi:hypothetical protein